MKTVSIVSTKGGPGKTTVTANLGAFCADANIRTLLIDLDTQPSLSSFYRLDHEAPGGIFELIAHNETRLEQIVSRTCIPNLSLILSNAPFNLLGKTAAAFSMVHILHTNCFLGGAANLIDA